jgi:hypothetical protein
MLYCRFKTGEAIDDIFLLENQEQIFLMAGRLGYRVVSHEVVCEGWFRCRLERAL